MFVATAGEQNALGLGPVVAASVAIDPWGVAELTRYHHERVVEHAPRSEVLDQDAHCLVVPGQFVFESGSDVGVVVEVARVQRDIPHARFNQPTGEQGLFSPARPILLAEAGIFFINIEGFTNLAGEHEVDGLLLSGIHLLKAAFAVDPLLQAIELFTERDAIHQP